MASLLKAMISIAAFIYPILIYFGLNYYSPSKIGLFLLLLFGLRFLFIKAIKRVLFWPVSLSIVVGGTLAIFTWFFDEINFMLWYPVYLSVSLFIIFTISILYPPTIIEQIARLQNEELTIKAVEYTRKVTVIWAVFFLINALIATWTVLKGDMEIWTLYNGFLAYLIIASIFIVEWLWRHRVKQRQGY